METAGKMPASPSSQHSHANFDKPDWATLPEEIACPLCRYNLRGLIEPRCPECGYQFKWADLLDPARRRHPYLFELHPERNFTSFLQTAFHGLRPVKFWTSVRANLPWNRRRLISYYLMVSLVLLIGAVSQVVATAVAFNVLQWTTPNRRIFMGRSTAYPTTAPSTSPAAFLWPSIDMVSFLIPPAILLIWPWLTLASLRLLRVSMRRAKIGGLHVLRCVIYSWDIVFWIGLAMITANVLYSLFVLGAYYADWKTWLQRFHVGPAIPAMVWFFAIPIFIYRIIIAYRRYLTFRHAASVILLTQIVVFLIVLTIIGYGVWIFGSETFDYRMIRFRF